MHAAIYSTNYSESITMSTREYFIERSANKCDNDNEAIEDQRDR